jgi:hypothetical protein
LSALLTATLLATAALLFAAITLLAATALFVTITIALLTAAALLAPSLPVAFVQPWLLLCRERCASVLADAQLFSFFVQL